MRALRLFVILVFLPAAVRAATLRGVVKSADGRPLAGAVIGIDGRTVLTDGRGFFAIDVAEGAGTLKVSASGFQPAEVRVSGAGPVDIALPPDAATDAKSPLPAVAETVVVSAIRADEQTPVTKSNLDRAEIERAYAWQDVPLMLRDTPAVDAYAEAGNGGSGYSYITLRGISPTRINFTLDGVPLADSEDMGTYFADFADLSHSLQSIQIQRGVGTSTVGSAAFAGSVNMESVALSQSRGLDLEAGGGSFGTRFATAGWQSGLSGAGLAMYARISIQQSEGFRESSGMRAHNLFVSAAKEMESSQLKLMAFTARERVAQSFLAADAATLQSDLRFNGMSPQERDNFGYNLAQLQYLNALSPKTNVTASAYFQRGYGWYQLYDDETTRSTLRRYGLDGLLTGGMVSLSTAHGPVSASYGVHVNEFSREHTRDVVGGARDYANYGTKGELNAFAKYSYDAGPWHLYGDGQVRTTDFHYHGDVAIAPIRWTFFNPKLGARYNLPPAGHATSGLYASAGMSTREPTRNDLFQGEDNATFAHDLHAVRPERILDLEAGYDLRAGHTTLKANLYDMELHHEIASTGELSDIGLVLRRNADRSYRRGLELEAAWQLTKSVQLRSSANLSRNRIRSWTQFFDVYDAAGNFTGSTPLVFHDVRPVLTPSVLFNQSIDWTPHGRVALGATGRYVGRSQLDNTNDPALATPAFFTLEATAGCDLGRGARVRLQVNNLLNNKRVFPSGYSYNFISNGAIAGTAYYYPQATRNAVVMVDFKR